MNEIQNIENQLEQLTPEKSRELILKISSKLNIATQKNKELLSENETWTASRTG